MNTEKVSKRKLQAAETKKKIYQAAEKLFKNCGFENVSVDSIVEMAGISKGGFYKHFESKDTLIVALINDYVNRVDLDYKSHLKSFHSKASSTEILISLVAKIAEIIIHTIGYDNIKAVYKANITKTINTNALMDYNRELYKIFNNIISRGMQQGEFIKGIHADIITKHCIIALRGLTYEWCIRYPDFDLKEQSLKHFEILLAGIKVR